MVAALGCHTYAESSLLAVAAISGDYREGFCQELKIGGADAVGALYRFCPPRTMTERKQAHGLRGQRLR